MSAKKMSNENEEGKKLMEKIHKRKKKPSLFCFFRKTSIEKALPSPGSPLYSPKMASIHRPTKLSPEVNR